MVRLTSISEHFLVHHLYFAHEWVNPVLLLLGKFSWFFFLSFAAILWLSSDLFCWIHPSPPSYGIWSGSARSGVYIIRRKASNSVTGRVCICYLLLAYYILYFLTVFFIFIQRVWLNHAIYFYHLVENFAFQ